MMIETANAGVADRLEEVARILNEQGANRFRVDAYLRAAATIRRLRRPLTELVRAEGVEGLIQLPGIGQTLARAIYQTVVSGRMPMLERLRGEADPVALLASVPGIGKVLASRFHEELGIDTLEELEAAAHDGRLADIGGLGEKRIAGIRDSLAHRLGRVRDRAVGPEPDEPPVSEILDVDREYREQAAKGLLRTIAPRRFNPEHQAWLPVLHTHRGMRHYTALFSNTARAHAMGRTRDWVVLYYDGGQGERQCTVITSQRGPLEGKRIVRGREAECLDFFFEPEANAASNASSD
ncbi:MAG TPA: helix-hairpin-helix domain-containing protein [Blastocatellia bacterium]|nr:helix-hairpin-helix domain-containing protein [Blastocatellia bacterium]